MPATVDIRIKRRMDPATWIFLTTAFVLFIASLTQPCFYKEGEGIDDAPPGIFWLLIGWYGVEYNPAWLANPAMGFAWLFILVGARPLVPALAATAAVSFSFSFLLASRMMIDSANLSMNAAHSLDFGSRRRIKHNGHYRTLSFGLPPAAGSTSDNRSYV